MNEIFRTVATFMPNPFGAQDRSALPDTDSPLRLAIHDVALFIQNALFIPLIVWPYSIFTHNPDHELYLGSRSNICSISLQVFLFFYTFVVFALLGIVLFFGAFALFPPQGCALGVFTTFLVMIAWFVLTRPGRYISANGNEFNHESWLFVNGVITDQGWLKLNCELLAKLFGRRVVGIHNRTFGPVFDLLECIIQRDFGYTTDDVRDLYAATKNELLKMENRRVVLIAHSQGAIIASMVVDRLLATLGEGLLNKLEVYTFGSAANHMHGGGVLNHIEHFANARDFFARSGVLAYYPLAGNKYDGTLYEDPGISGHMLNMHYLDQEGVGHALNMLDLSHRNLNIFAIGRPAANSQMATYLFGGGALGPPIAPPPAQGS